MTAATYRTSRPDPWTQPRPFSDASLRRHVHGPLRPMDAAELPFWRRLIGA